VIDYGIPTLDLSMQATALPERWLKWGTCPKREDVRGAGYHFYARDHKFSGLWKDPHAIVRSGCSCVAEVNYTTYSDQALASVLYDIYRKRTLSRYWGELGIRLFADLNVIPRDCDWNLLGVPTGWKAYATRKHRGVPLEVMEAEHDLALEHSRSRDILFVVFGGGRPTRELCGRRGWHWVPEQCRMVRGLR
jgi:hypothetical protein